MITCVIIDDEKLAREALRLMLERYFSDKVKILAMAAGLKEGVLEIYQHHPDLVFLDIEMPDEDGFRIFNYFQQVNFSLVFTTAYKEYAIKAIKVAALDYILKPISLDSLQESIALFEKKKQPGIPAENIERLVQSLTQSSQNKEKVALPTLNGFQMERVNSILYCEADQNYTHVFTTEGGKVLVSNPISIVQQMLPPEIFFRIHKSHLVNLNYVKTYSRTDGFHVVLENGTRLSVASRRNDEFLKALTR